MRCPSLAPLLAPLSPPRSAPPAPTWLQRVAWACVAVGLLAGPAMAQTARKPSGFRSHEAQAAPDAVASLPAIDSRADFDRLARVYDAGTPLALPHLIFVIDRASRDAQGRERVHYINARRYQLHEQFVVDQHLAPPQDRAAWAAHYRNPNRRFVLGTLSWQPAVQRWVWEAWEGDQLTPLLVALTQARLQATFFAPLAFKTNSTQHEAAARGAQLEFISQAEIVREQPFLPLNVGQRSGRLRLIDSVESTPDLQPSDIVVLREVPLALPPVAGVVTTQPSTVLSHVNLLAKSWGIPNAYVRDAFTALRPLAGRWVSLRVTRTGYDVAPDPQAEQRAAQAASRVTANLAAARAMPPLAEPQWSKDELVELADLRAADHRRCGSKAANLGEIDAARRAGRLTQVAPVPDGFCIPFAHYAEFMRQPEVRERIARAERSPGFATDPARRQAELAALRRDLVELPVNSYRSDQWLQAWHDHLIGTGVFVRSSSNAEDLPGFSGAGLFATVPHVTGEAELLRAVKTVWASVFNFEAVEARRQSGTPFERVAMGVFVQQAVAARNSGVLVTADPFDPQHRNATYISAKRGLGIKVVEGRRVAEQVLYDRSTRAVQVLTRSGETSELRLDARGGVRDVPLDASDSTRAVLTDAMVRRLSDTGQQLRTIFNGRDLDVEWATDEQGRLVILQARPYVNGTP